jgi:HEPN domain-containing protein
MNPLAAEWVAKAEADWAVAARELARSDKGSADIVAYHAQQCAEKYLKACLVEAGVVPPRTHDLRIVAGSESSLAAATGPSHAALRALSRLAVIARYPGYTATLSQAETAVRTAEAVRALCRKRLALP